MKKQLSGILIVNIITAFLSMITSFVLPKMLSIPTYGEIKSYQFYLSYIGLLHFGFADSIYLKYGGKDINSIDKQNANNEILHFLLLQFTIMIPIILFLVFFKNFVLIVIAVTIMPYNVLSYCRLLYQATGEFGNYMEVLLFNSVSLFMFNMLLAVFFRIDLGAWYIIGYTVVYWLCGLMAYRGLKKCCLERYYKFDVNIIIDNVKSGISLMLGNFSGVLFSGLDRWVIKIFMSIEAFAFYSFANSIMNIMEVLLSPVNITMYNYLIKHNNIDTQKYVKNIYTIFTFGFLSSMFIIKHIILHFIPKYSPSINIIFILAIAYSFMVVIKGLYVNLYKVNKQQKKYLRTILISLTFALFSNLIATFIFKSPESIAVCTVISVVFWERICLLDFKFLKNNFIQNLYRFLIIGVYIATGIYTDPLVGFFLYMACFTALTFFVYRKDSLNFLRTLIKGN